MTPRRLRRHGIAPPLWHYPLPLTPYPSRFLSSFDQFDIRARDHGRAAVGKADFHHAHVTLGRNLLELGRQTRDFADFSKQRVSNDANLVTDPDAFPLRNGCRA